MLLRPKYTKYRVSNTLRNTTYVRRNTAAAVLVMMYQRYQRRYQRYYRYSKYCCCNHRDSRTKLFLFFSCVYMYIPGQCPGRRFDFDDVEAVTRAVCMLVTCRRVHTLSWLYDIILSTKVLLGHLRMKMSRKI